MSTTTILALATVAILTLASDAHSGMEEGRAAFARKDYPAALREWLPLAEQGQPEAQLNIGFMYHEGFGVPIDDAKAAEWYLKAARQGFAEAQAEIGSAYFLGLGVPQDYRLALEWSQKAADQRHPHGEFNVGSIYINGLGVPRDFKKGVYWSRRAAEQGDAAAQLNLAVLLTEGAGVPKNDIEALMWLFVIPRQLKDPISIAAPRGAPKLDDAVRELREVLLSRMTPSQIGESQRRAANWKPKRRF